MIRFLLILLISTQTFAQTSVEKAKKLWEEKNNSEAKKMLLAINKKSKEYAVAQYYLGRITVSEGNVEDASEYFEEAVSANDKVADYHVWLGNSYATQALKANPLRQGMLAPKMRSAWEKAIELDPNNIDSRRSLLQFYLQAPGFMGGSIPKAKEMAKQIAKVKPAEGHMHYGNIYFKENNLQAAEKEYIEAAKADPTYVTALGTFYVNRKQFDRAFACYEEALRKNPEDYTSIYQIGRASAISGQKLDRGEECLKKYLTRQPKQNEPSWAGANMRLGQIFEKRGNKAEAKKHFEAALKLDTNQREAKEGLERVTK